MADRPVPPSIRGGGSKHASYRHARGRSRSGANTQGRRTCQAGAMVGGPARHRNRCLQTRIGHVTRRGRMFKGEPWLAAQATGRSPEAVFWEYTRILGPPLRHLDCGWGALVRAQAMHNGPGALPVDRYALTGAALWRFPEDAEPPPSCSGHEECRQCFYTHCSGCHGLGLRNFQYCSHQSFMIAISSGVPKTSARLQVNIAPLRPISEGWERTTRIGGRPQRAGSVAAAALDV